MQIQPKNYAVKAVVNVQPKEVCKAVEVAVRNALKCNNGDDIVILTPLPCVAVEVRKTQNGQ